MISRRTLLATSIFLPLIGTGEKPPAPELVEGLEPVSEPAELLIICDGNSITSPRRGYTDWPYTLAIMTSIPTVNVAVSSNDIADCRSRAGVAVDRLVGLSDETWVIIWEGTNYLRTTGNVQECYDQHVAYCQERRAALRQAQRPVGGRACRGRVLIGTIISREPTNAIYTLEQRHEFNDLLRQGWPSFADGLLDFASIPELGADDAWMNPTYFFDGIHLADPGSELVANFLNKL